MNAEESDGNWRGRVDTWPKNLFAKGILIGPYLMQDYSDTQLLIMNNSTGEMGVFPKADFEAYVAAFFGLNF